MYVVIGGFQSKSDLLVTSGGSINLSCGTAELSTHLPCVLCVSCVETELWVVARRLEHRSEGKGTLVMAVFDEVCLFACTVCALHQAISLSRLKFCLLPLMFTWVLSVPITSAAFCVWV